MGAAKKAGGQIAAVAKPVIQSPSTYIMPTTALPAAGLKAAGGAIGGQFGKNISDIGAKLGIPSAALDKLLGANGIGPNQKQKVDTTAATEAYIKQNMPAYAPAVAKVADAAKLKASTVATPDQVNASTVATPDKVTAGTYDPKLLDTAALGVDTRAIDAMRAKGLTQGQTDWAKLSTQQNALNELTAKDTAGAQALAGRDSALSSLAMRGGLGGGAGERLATSASREANAARQAATRTRQGADLNVNIADESQKNTLLNQVSAQDLANAQFGASLAQYNTGASNDASKFNIGTGIDTQKFNVGTALDANKFNAGATQQASEFNTTTGLDANKFNAGQTQGANQFNIGTALDVNKFNTGAVNANTQALNQFNLGKFGTQISGYGAAKTGDAIANGGKK